MLLSLPVAPFLYPFLFLMNPFSPERANVTVTSPRLLSQVSRLWPSFLVGLCFSTCVPPFWLGSQELGPHLTPFLCDPLAWSLTPRRHHVHQETQTFALTSHDITFVTHRLKIRCTKTKLIFFPETWALQASSSHHPDSQSWFLLTTLYPHRPPTSNCLPTSVISTPEVFSRSAQTHTPSFHSSSLIWAVAMT